MRNYKIAKTISIVSYLMIILMGSMMGVPFFIWLLFTLFDFGNIDQLFAFYGIIGLTISFVIFNSKRKLIVLLFDVISFILLSSPLVRRMTAIPIVKYNYLAFIIPATIFVLFYLFSLYLSFKDHKGLILICNHPEL